MMQVAVHHRRLSREQCQRLVVTTPVLVIAAANTKSAVAKLGALTPR